MLRLLDDVVQAPNEQPIPFIKCMSQSGGGTAAAARRWKHPTKNRGSRKLKHDFY